MAWNTAMAAMIGMVAVSVLLADGERQRVDWIRAMRRCLLRMNGLIRYERPSLADMLRRIELKGTRQERELTRLLHASAERLENSANPQLTMIFLVESARLPGYGVLSEEDRTAFEAVLGELGRTGLEEQIRLIERADERLRQREETLAREAGRRAQMIRTLGLTGGAAAFLLLI